MWRISGVGVAGYYSEGKTSLISQFIDDTFDKEYHATLGVDLKTKLNFQISKEPYTVDYFIFDIAPSDCGIHRRRGIFQNLTALVVAYSITSLRSLEAAQDILNILEDMNIDKQVFLVGLKSDLQDHRVVSFATGEELARKYGTFFQELSSFNSMQVQEFFRHIAELLPVQKVSSVGDKGKL